MVHLDSLVVLVEIALPFLSVGLLFAWGAAQIRSAPVQSQNIRITLVQPSIPQTLIWDPGKDDERLRELISLSEQALTNKTDLLAAADPSIKQYLHGHARRGEHFKGN